MSRTLIIFLLFLAGYSSAGCRKDPETIIKTITVTDTLVVTQTDTVLLTVTDTVSLNTFIHDTATTFILSRHCETTGIGSDPDLSTAGTARAQELLRVLKNVPLDAVYSTNFKRTIQTATPTATDKALTVKTYNPNALSPFVDNALATHHGKTILVVGHSNTTPSLLNVLTGTTLYQQLPETEYDNLYIVTVFEKGRATVTHLKYGE